MVSSLSRNFWFQVLRLGLLHWQRVKRRNVEHGTRNMKNIKAFWLFYCFAMIQFLSGGDLRRAAWFFGLLLPADCRF